MARGCESRGIRPAATIINGMRARRIGRTLGIGVRIAARLATGRAAEPGRSIEGPNLTPDTQPALRSHGDRAHAHLPAPQSGARSPNQTAGQEIGHRAVQAGQVLGQTGRKVTQGVGGVLRPLRRVGGILWLEVTGVFFLLPVVVFTPVLWRKILAYRHTTDHKTLWLTSGIIAIFLYLGVSSFWRARRRSASGQ